MESTAWFFGSYRFFCLSMNEVADALEKLKAFNRMVCADAELRRQLVDGPYDILQRQQGQLLALIRDYLKHPKETLRALKRSDVLAPGTFFAGVTACFLMVWATCARKADVLLFAVDKTSSKGERDFRIEGLYRYLETASLRYVEVFHTLPSEVLKNAWSRKRTALYHEAFEFLADLRFRWSSRHASMRTLAAGLACEGFSETDRPLARALALRLLKSGQSVPLRVRLYVAFVRRFKPRAILSIDDTRHYHDLVAAARSLDIPFYAFQHGLFTVSHVGWLDDGCGSNEKKIRPDVLVVWSEYWKRELLRLGTYFKERELLVGGSPKPEAPVAPPPVEDGTFGILIPYESGAPRAEVGAYVRRFLEDPSVRIFFVARPDLDIASQLKDYGVPAERLTVTTSAEVGPHLSKMHVTCGVCSTYLYDALAFHRPVVILETSRTTGLAMVENGFADKLATGGKASDLKRIVAASVPQAEARAQKYLGGGVTLGETMKQLLGETRS